MKVAPEHPWGLSVRVSASIADFVLTTRAIFKPAWSMPVAAIAGSRRSAAGELNLAFNAVSDRAHGAVLPGGLCGVTASGACRRCAKRGKFVQITP
jgi:hypothetical protein